MASLTIDQFVRVETAVEPSFSSDGKHVAYRSNRSGVFQVFLVGAEGERIHPAEQLTDTGGVVYSAKFRPHSREILYITDQGGNEQYQIHLLDADTRTSRPLAAAPGIIHNPGAFSSDGRCFSYGSNKRDRRFFDIYVSDLHTGEERLVYRQDGMNLPGRFNDDAGALLIRRPNLDKAAGDNDLYLLDLSRNDPPIKLTGHREVAQYSGACFHPSGHVLVLSDEEREFIGLQRIDPESLTRQYIHEPDWDIEQFSLGPGGEMLAVIVNEDGYSRLSVHRMTPRAEMGPPVTIPEPPAGILGNLRWCPDGQALVFTLVSAGQASNVWLLDLENMECRPVSQSAMGGVPPEVLPEPQTIRYPSFDGRPVPAFFFVPHRAQKKEKLPCVIIVHGGPESQSRPSLWGVRGAAAAYLLALGRIAVLAPNVRGSTGYGKAYQHADDVEKRMDAVRDLIAALDWLEADGVVDPKRIAVMGGSYGGFMTLAGITEAPERWAAAIDLFGIANFETFLEKTGPWRRKHRAAEYGEDPGFLRSISPLHKADRIQTPLLVIQGDQDVRVPPHESEQIVETVRSKGGVVDYILFEQEGHGIQKIANRLTMEKRICAFLEKHLSID